MTHRILLYYCYTPLADPAQFREEHHRFCLENHLRGRIIVAAEGLNGTVSGLAADCARYVAHLKADPRFAAVDFKVEEHNGHAFRKLHVRVKPEIVHADLPHVDPNRRTGVYLAPAEFKRVKNQEDVVILDVRSTYEHRLGRFKNAVTLDIEHFREFSEKVKELEPFKDKKIITYCTGGIKCEKASAYLLEQGFENVYQLHGGIIKYGLTEGGEDFEGQCYVFDSRLAVPVNRVNPTVVSRCHACDTTSDRMINCANPHCNAHLPLCESCGWELAGACSSPCQSHPDKRPYDGTGHYPKDSNGYNPYLNAKR